MDISKLDRQGLLDYIESLEAKTASLEEKMEDLKAQVDVLNMDMDDFKVPEDPVPELHVSEQTADALAEAASIFDDFDDIEVDPAPVKNGVVKLGPVTAEESYIPVAP
ncbi:MAG: bZIP transcription factor, partial [Clostridia bacterium]|nr:bZIP transcription factor [Clostridia bacterium]